MIHEKIKQTTIEIFVLGTVIAKTTIQSLQRHGILADTGISMLQYGVLRALRHQPLTIAELSKLMMVDPSTLVSVIDVLSRKGLAQRGRDPDDRRRVPISLTEKGNALLADHQAQGPFATEDNPMIESIEAMGEDKALQLLTLLRELVVNLPDGKEILDQVSTRVLFHSTGHIEAQEIDA